MLTQELHTSGRKIKAVSLDPENRKTMDSSAFTAKDWELEECIKKLQLEEDRHPIYGH